jgi:hypothetical protein
VAGGLAVLVGDGVATLDGDQQAANPLADAEPDPAIQADRGGDLDGDGSSYRGSLADVEQSANDSPGARRALISALARSVRCPSASFAMTRWPRCPQAHAGVADWMISRQASERVRTRRMTGGDRRAAIEGGLLRGI